MGSSPTGRETARARLGRAGEDATAAWYRDHGYDVIERNWRNGRSGEIDLVVGKPGLVVFCEVKTRSSDRFGTGLEAVTADKQRRLRRLAAAWLAAHHDDAPDGRRRALRFDVASVGPDLSVDVVEAAF